MPTAEPAPSGTGSPRPNTADLPTRMAEATGQRADTLFVTLFILGLAGLWTALLTVSSVTLSLRVADLSPDGKAAALSTIASAGAAVALFANPVFGRLSDLSASRWGQRRPFMIGGGLLGFAALLLIGVAPSLLVVGIGWCLAQLFFNAALAAITAVMPERIPDHLKGRVSGLMGMTSQVGVVAGTFIVQFTGTHGLGMFVVPGAIGVGLLLAFALHLREVPRSRAELPRFTLLDIPRSLWINPIRHRDFALAWLGRFLTWIAVSLLTTYKTYFLIDRLGYTSESAAPILFWAMLILAVTVILGSNVAGTLSDLVRRRKVFVIGASLIFGAGMVTVAAADSVEAFLVGVAVAGIGQGAYMGVDYAMVAALLPNKDTDAAKGMGVFNLSSTVPQTIAPALAPLFLAIGGGGNYTALYLGAGIFSVVGAVVIQFIRGSR
ncbi:MFS transporter [Marinactinospora rubrisoli]|uniref:MFS transporter n=1 Tax=Marinactinospora rubrisoli TaxID=2715399 RepID=A0ABW2KHH6_9ACTN